MQQCNKYDMKETVKVVLWNDEQAGLQAMTLIIWSIIVLSPVGYRLFVVDMVTSLIQIFR